MDFRKTYFILPNLFTLASVFCGFYSIVLTARIGEGEGSDEDLLYKAALAIVFGLFFDGADGRIARLTKTQSDLGLQLDSLADVITFGVAPALLVYRWGLEDLGRVGLGVGFLFLAAGALRLARFNVLAMRDAGKPGKYMIGLPIPIAANMIVALVLTNHAIGVTKAVNQTSIAVLVSVLGYLMISRVRFRTMKDLTLNKRTVAASGALLVIVIIVGARINAPAVFMTLITLFIALGLAEEVIFYRRRRKEQRTASEPDDSEADVLAELGADGAGSGAAPARAKSDAPAGPHPPGAQDVTRHPGAQGGRDDH
ncbi:MAG: CDP-diacylglycerol--serine O-phosphatidyltransferase [Nannocystaceae bacterium]